MAVVVVSPAPSVPHAARTKANAVAVMRRRRGVTVCLMLAMMSGAAAEALEDKVPGRAAFRNTHFTTCKPVPVSPRLRWQRAVRVRSHRRRRGPVELLLRESLGRRPVWMPPHRTATAPSLKERAAPIRWNEKVPACGPDRIQNRGVSPLSSRSSGSSSSRSRMAHMVRAIWAMATAMSGSNSPRSTSRIAFSRRE